ncbi:hypothetical protein FRB94_010589 [Tulasnella sp. JGI-2019a]|nr:hypothetical protein FRB94_010589 [Tulasnella sp. JGI-2019a]KAG9017860.1 hypothetical protein FRB93_004671 [Tulasnella sp. JGI-2019a]
MTPASANNQFASLSSFSFAKLTGSNAFVILELHYTVFRLLERAEFVQESMQTKVIVKTLKHADYVFVNLGGGCDDEGFVVEGWLGVGQRLRGHPSLLQV